MTDLQLWIGVECTLNRVRDQYHNQLYKNGHLTRIEDLQLFAQMGAKRIRYPFLWEMVQPLPHIWDWRWTDERAAHLERLNLTPIAGFLHHGSGPMHTNLLDPQFPEKLAFFARNVAERYPWIEDFTPVNEILTTARFSCLYGHWYPHQANDGAFIRALFNQCKATILSMQEIRRLNPRARLIQTEDMGRTQSTEKLAYQRDFDNERRWLSFDLLSGLVNTHHPMYDYLTQSLHPDELKWLQDNACPPDILGINHYLLSNRFLDHRVDLYPSFLHGGNKFEPYVDVGAIDTGQAQPLPVKDVLQDVWNRYHRPIAVTEVHARGYRESQMRWLHEVWQAAVDLKNEGVDIQAVTAWSLLGSFDWNMLCTQDNRFYETGIFDLRSANGNPRPTLLSEMTTGLGTKGAFEHPVLETEGWWKNNRRIIMAMPENVLHSPLRKSGRPLLITGGQGTLSRAFARTCAARDISFHILGRKDLDITDRHNIRKVLQELRPWAVINAAGYVKVDQAESEAELCYRQNVEGPQFLAEECALLGIQFMTFSSDLVFNGENKEPYLESHDIAPLNVYGRSKAEAEKKVLAAYDKALVIRTSSFFGPWDDANFVTQCLRSISQNKKFYVAHDLKISPTYVPHLANAALDFLLDRENGIIHVANGDQVSWSDFATMAVRRHAPHKQGLLVKRSFAEFQHVARRPLNSALLSERVKVLPSLDHALENYFHQIEVMI
ncbi:family 1 glycosylhydrolase [Bdellovibrio sp. 22V]|uniref:family 1 glycosylhydrolase n=1 Tax=Bdellovibrio TaxID=958 RepID=UPI00254394D6|nr:family 1 glycosylhydrolase [Bdellovibrio sp. 22V]WII71494.1 family 1 glycosylhydrolase [Bdellovibrio sp. 22V]